MIKLSELIDQLREATGLYAPFESNDRELNYLIANMDELDACTYARKLNVYDSTSCGNIWTRVRMSALALADHFVTDSVTRFFIMESVEKHSLNWQIFRVACEQRWLIQHELAPDRLLRCLSLVAMTRYVPSGPEYGYYIHSLEAIAESLHVDLVKILEKATSFCNDAVRRRGDLSMKQLFRNFIDD